MLKNSLYYAVKVGDLTYAAFFDEKDAMAYAILMTLDHPGEWYIEDTASGKRWKVNRNAIKL